MFAPDMESNKEKLTEEIKGKRVCEMGGAGSIGSSFIKAVLRLEPKGVRVAGSYSTKRTFYTSLRNQQENILYGHPTVKPLQLIRNFIVNSCPVGGVVLDPFMGSGTTAVAAAAEGCRYIGYETEARWCEVARRRINDFINDDHGKT